MLSLNPKDGKQFAAITKDGKVKEVLHLIERDSYRMVEDPALRGKLGEFCELDPAEVPAENGEDLVKGFSMKEGYQLRPIPPSFSSEGNNQRVTMSITGKSGSGKSFFTALYVGAYHHMYPKNNVYYVSANRIDNDLSYAPLLKKESFKKVLIAIDLKTISSVVEFSRYRNCVFVFDDVLDVQVSLAPEKLQADFAEEKKKTYYAKERAKQRTKEEKVREMLEKKGLIYKAPTKEEIEGRIRKPDADDLTLRLGDSTAIVKLNKWKSDTIKRYIQDSIQALLKLGRKNGISVITTTHRFFDRDDTAQCSIDEAGSVVLFPYGNVSKEKLTDFLRVKLCFDLTQARAIADRTFKQFEYLLINTSGSNFFMTSNRFEIL